MGSQSPRRKALFEYLGVPFQVKSSEAEEPDWIDESAQDYTLKLARLKFQALQKELSPSDLVVTSDTTVSVDEEILNKPDDRDHAREMILKLSGKSHYVCTSYVIGNANKELFHQSVVSEVLCRTITEEELKNYLGQNEYQDKAGAYGIQGAALTFIQSIKGSYSNIVGFPIDSLIDQFQSVYGAKWRNHFV